jgi:hypothetical protein
MPDVKRLLSPDESELVGEWLRQGDQVLEDSVAARIRWLTERHLEQVAMSAYGAWETLYRDPNDGRYWERTYPHSDWHGGGPPCLTISRLMQQKRNTRLATKGANAGMVERTSNKCADKALSAS